MMFIDSTYYLLVEFVYILSCHFDHFLYRVEDAGSDMYLTAGPFPGTQRQRPDFAPAGPFS